MWEGCEMVLGMMDGLGLVGSAGDGLMIWRAVS